LVDKEGIPDLVNEFKLQFNYDLENSKTFFKGQTFCAHYDGNEAAFTGQTWSDLRADADELGKDQKTSDCST